mmetsp:Transcript_119460/g.372164  ORF Transcript_119460/g.372164 Transcript_119460/m.372164 type:complete len:237 (-) Transcript_119460:28-738(-)
MQKPASIAYIGLENRALTPSRKLRDASRFHQPASPRRSPQQPREAAYEAREFCRFHKEQAPHSARESSRFHAESPRGLSCSLRSLPSDRPGERPAAGKSSLQVRRRDLPPDTPDARGRARSTTPEYHNRYRRNTLGTSLPGASMAQGPPPSPCSRRAALFDPRENQLTASCKSQAACRFHNTSASDLAPTSPRVQRKPFAFSSTEAKPTSGLAGSLHGAGSAPRPRRAERLRDSLI